LQVAASSDATPWLCSARDEEEIKAQMEGTDLILSVGGDGTILRVARSIVPREIPILGINLGKLGFMTELNAEEAISRVPELLAGAGWVDKRSMLQAELLSAESKTIPGSISLLPALNDVVVWRGATSHVISVKTSIDGMPLITFRGDGVIVATATGSTGYSLAVGGPILHPQAEEILLKPISPHLTMAYALVLPPAAVIELELRTDYQAALSIDGQLDFKLQSGDIVRVKRSPHTTNFLRIRPISSFYSSLEQRLRKREIG
jgi:NAD+ kinase